MYENVNIQDLTLRDVLAVDRTALAYERTALGWVRTGAGGFLAGVTLAKLFETEAVIVLGGGLMVVSPLLALVGVVRVMRAWRRIRHLSPKPEHAARLGGG